MCEVDIRSQFCCESFMICKLFAVVERNGVGPARVRLQQARYCGCHAFGMLAADMARQHVA